MQEVIVVEKSGPISGEVVLHGAKNATLVMMAAVLVSPGVSRLFNVPNIADVHIMIKVLAELGVKAVYDELSAILTIDATTITGHTVPALLMQQMRASILVMGALLARVGKASLGLPGGDAIGKRPIDFHLKAFRKMGAEIVEEGTMVSAHATELRFARISLEYPSVGATENIILAALGAQGRTTIINAALEPEITDLIALLSKMGASISVEVPATIHIDGGVRLRPVEYEVMPDRLEAGSLLLAAAITGGSLSLPNARPETMDLFLAKLEEMGHHIEVNSSGIGINFTATQNPQSVSIKTAPYPGFPTDLQAPMSTMQLAAHGVSVIEETVFENRLQHIDEFKKMGAHAECETPSKAHVVGLQKLIGTEVVASDIRASLALVLAGFIAEGKTYIKGVHHWRRGYADLEVTLARLGANICIEKQMPKPLLESKVHAVTV
jgi:UDP-N-acetylglucosamine 1-carboxyvinyltransferase